MKDAVHNTGSFQHSDPAWRAPIELPDSFLSPSDIRPGDIIYTRRAKGYQRLTALAGDTWRHIGLATSISGCTWMAAMTPDGNAAHPLPSFLSRYDTIAVQRLTPCDEECALQLHHDVIADMNLPAAFHSKPELASIGLLSLGRLAKTPRRFERTRVRLIDHLLNRPGFGTRSICTTPIARNLWRLCPDHRVRLDVSSSKHKRATDQSPIAHLQLALPDDVWRAMCPHTESFWIKKDDELSPVYSDETDHCTHDMLA